MTGQTTWGRILEQAEEAAHKQGYDEGRKAVLGHGDYPDVQDLIRVAREEAFAQGVDEGGEQAFVALSQDSSSYDAGFNEGAEHGRKKGFADGLNSLRRPGGVEYAVTPPSATHGGKCLLRRINPGNTSNVYVGFFHSEEDADQFRRWLDMEDSS